MRERFGSTMVPVKNASKKIEKIFSEGHLSVTLLDQNVDWYQGVFVDFFGRPACTNKKLVPLGQTKIKRPKALESSCGGTCDTGWDQNSWNTHS